MHSTFLWPSWQVWDWQKSPINPRLRERQLDDSDADIPDGTTMGFLELEIPLASEKRPVQKLMATALAFILIAHIVLIEMSNHPEMEAQTNGDRALIEADRRIA